MPSSVRNRTTRGCTSQAVITTLQVLGQTTFHLDLSITQILVSIGTCAVLEVAIGLGSKRTLAWPASALLTGNGVAFSHRAGHPAR